MKPLLNLFTSLLIICALNVTAQHGKVLETYPNGSPLHEIRASNDSSYFILIDYFKNGKYQSIDTMVNDHLNGWSTEFNSDGSVYVAQLFSFDKPMVQKFYLYFKDGMLKSEWTSDTMRRRKDPEIIEPANGLWKEFYHNGKLKMAGRKNEHRNNDGEWIYYDDSGTEVKRVFYINGTKLDN